jgi:hypothetical protein
MRGISMSSRMMSGRFSCSSGDGVVDDQRERAPVALLEHRAIRRARAPFRTHQRSHIEDHHDAPVAEDGGAGDAADTRDLRPQRFDHDLAAADQLVRDQRGRVLARADEHDGHRHVRLGQTGGPETDESAKLLEAILLPAIFEQLRVLAEVPRHDVAR